MKKCPSCSNNVDAAQMCCPTCGWQFASPTLCAVKPGTIARSGQTIARGVTRPNWICRDACQLAVLVRDKSGSMKGQKARDASQASMDLVKVLAEPSNKDGFFCSVVDFASSAEIIHPATKAAELVGQMSQLKPGFLGGCTNITDSLAKASDIVSGFTPVDNRKQLRPLVLLFSDGGHNEGPSPDAVAAALKADGDLICIAFGGNADEEDLRKWASPNLFTRCASGADLRKFFASVGATLQATRARGINATQALAGLNVS
ncbi:MAG: VWA domain-containing protein [Lentisphaerae bacterium]|nr:VWA domain-containing protein [Lentisphaerota bacterium]